MARILPVLALMIASSVHADAFSTSLSVVRAGCNASGWTYYTNTGGSRPWIHYDDDGGNTARCYYRGTDLVLNGIQGSALIEDMCRYAFQYDKTEVCKANAYKELTRPTGESVLEKK